MVSAGGLAALGAGTQTAYSTPSASGAAAHALLRATADESHQKRKKPKKHKHKKHKPKHAVDHSREPCGGVRPPKPGGGRYTCTFTDNFNGSTLDPAKWTVVTSADSSLTTRGGGCYRSDPQNVSVGGGALRLTSAVASTPFFCRNGLLGIVTTHSAASVVSTGKFAQTYGRFEFRAMFPKTNADVIDSALWMYPQHQAYGRWPASGEIDVAERFGSTRGYKTYPALHYAGARGQVTNLGRNCPVAQSDTRFHTYAVEWTKTSIKFYYDDRWCFTGAWAPAAPLIHPQPFDKPFYLVMTQTDRPRGTPAGTHDTMTIDWVRAWR
jgi:beta-glucanase (GH16 family)